MEPRTQQSVLNRNRPVRTFGLAAAAALLGLAGLLAGCTSLTQPAGAGFASVVIANGTEAQVIEETVRVFTAAGWRADLGPDDEMTFEREGSTWDHVAYGSNIRDTPVLNRVRARAVPLADGTVRLQCQAYIVRDGGGRNMEDEIRLHLPRSGPYQQLLDKVAAGFVSQERR
jgi:hypothetical protein